MTSQLQYITASARTLPSTSVIGSIFDHKLPLTSVSSISIYTVNTPGGYSIIEMYSCRKTTFTVSEITLSNVIRMVQ